METLSCSERTGCAIDSAAPITWRNCGRSAAPDSTSPQRSDRRLIYACRIGMYTADRPVVSRRAPDPPVLALMPRRRLSGTICCARTMRRLVLIPGHGLWGYAGEREADLESQATRGGHVVPMIALALGRRLDQGRPASSRLAYPQGGK